MKIRRRHMWYYVEESIGGRTYIVFFNAKPLWVSVIELGEPFK